MKVVFINRRRAFCGALAVLGIAAPTRAGATPRPLPFTYTTETLGAGDLEVEEFVDMTPVKGTDTTGTGGGSGNSAWYAGTQVQTEFEYGISDRLELGLYVVYVPPPAGFAKVAEMTEVTGVKERLRYVLADPGVWPIDVGLYGELVQGQTEAEVEVKVLLQRRIGRMRVDANLWAEYELDYVTPERDIVLNPTLGMTYEINPTVHLGAEGWLRVKFPNPDEVPRAYDLGPAGYAGPAVLLALGKLWWSTGLYARVTEVEHVMQPGEPFGPVWMRTIIGLSL